MKKLLLSFLVIFLCSIIAKIGVYSKNKYDILQDKAVKRKLKLERTVRYHSFDFKKCRPSLKRIDFGFGSTTFQVVGASKHGCVMLYGKEIENPGWDGSLDRICVIPFRIGKVSYKITNYGINLSSLSNYCTSTPVEKKKSNKKRRSKTK